ncbi:hypothetical protein ACFSTH_16950 [Paenibacillus yanchengensis]|uniref:DDE-type integrase/transposase/recombinase n=1 Tax=Paenibacillus yanchengensis TaxID=2035833 RepID=A0ABW4YPZ5_9BACL
MYLDDELVGKNKKLVSTYTIAQFKPSKAASNEDNTKNSLNRAFQQTEIKRVVVSDLTYVRVGSRWNYVCTLIDFFNREIIGHSAGIHKDAALVSRAFASIEGGSAILS